MPVNVSNQDDTLLQSVSYSLSRDLTQKIARQVSLTECRGEDSLTSVDLALLLAICTMEKDLGSWRRGTCGETIAFDLEVAI